MISCSGVDVAGRFKFFRWRENANRVTPATVANTLHPVAWYQGHLWVECELGLLSEARGAFSSYITYSSSYVAIDSGIVIRAKNVSGTTTTTTAHGVFPDHVESNIEDRAETITVYHLKAKWVDPFV